MRQTAAGKTGLNALGKHSLDRLARYQLWIALAWAVLAGLSLSSAPCLAAGVLPGKPPIERFAPDIEVIPQNYCVVQDSRGVVFMCSASGVLEFDGETWRLWRLPNREMVRSLAVAADDTVYVGGYNIFGKLRRNAAGAAEFEDLSTGFAAQLGKREFADIWNTVLTPEGVYFRGLEDVFFWDPNTRAQAHWRHSGRFGLLVHHDGQTLLQWRGAGFKVREGNAWRLLPGTAAIKTPVFTAAALNDGSL